MKLRLKLGLALMMVLSLLGCASSPTPQITPAVPLPTEETITVQEDGWYSTKEEVVEYLEAYGHLPENYITKKEAQESVGRGRRKIHRRRPLWQP